MNLNFDPIPSLSLTEKLFRITHNKRRYLGRFKDIKTIASRLQDVEREKRDRRYWGRLFDALKGKR